MNDVYINRALLFSAKYFNDSCHNHGKPVYLHCLRVAGDLHRLGYEDELIAAAILHDLLEDTDCTRENIAEAFGEEMAVLIEALSFSPEDGDKWERNRRCLEACAVHGRGAMIVKCADIADNSSFFSKASPVDQVYLRKKFAYALDLAERTIPGEAVLEWFREKIKFYL